MPKMNRVADGSIRQTARRFLPRRVRWTLRLVYRTFTGWYIREASRRAQMLATHMQDQAAAVESHGEMLEFFLRRLYSLENETVALNAPIEDVERRINQLDRSIAQLRDDVKSWSAPVMAFTAKPIVGTAAPQEIQP